MLPAATFFFFRTVYVKKIITTKIHLTILTKLYGFVCSFIHLTVTHIPHPWRSLGALSLALSWRPIPAFPPVCSSDVAKRMTIAPVIGCSGRVTSCLESDQRLIAILSANVPSYFYLYLRHKIGHNRIYL